MGKSKKITNPGETKTIMKPLFALPYGCSLSWPYLDKSVNKQVIQEIKQEVPAKISHRKSSKNRKKETAKGDAKKIEGQLSLESTKVSFKKVLLLGINAVTKALERGSLLLVLVCKSAKPINITHHLITLCAIRETPACCLSGLNETLSPMLEMKSVLAVGFTAIEDNPLQDLIEFIADKAPPLIVPWAHIWRDRSPKTGENATLKKKNFAEGKEDDKNDDTSEPLISKDFIDLNKEDKDDRKSTTKSEFIVDTLDDSNIRNDKTDSMNNETEPTVFTVSYADVKTSDAIQQPADVDRGFKDDPLGTPKINSTIQETTRVGSDTSFSDRTFKRMKRALETIEGKNDPWDESKKMKVEDVSYMLSETQFNMRQATVKVKKQNKK